MNSSCMHIFTYTTLPLFRTNHRLYLLISLCLFAFYAAGNKRLPDVNWGNAANWSSVVKRLTIAIDFYAKLLMTRQSLNFCLVAVPHLSLLNSAMFLELYLRIRYRGEVGLILRPCTQCLQRKYHCHVRNLTRLLH